MHAEYAYLGNSRQMACSQGGRRRVLGGGCWLLVLGEGCSLERHNQATCGAPGARSSLPRTLICDWQG
jgi:hypothetical protein